MAEKIGRLGYLGLAIEASAGVAESAPDIFVPFTENSLRGHHEALADTSARTSRVADYSSVLGKRWGEGTVAMYLDSINVGYFLKLALGQESNTTKSASPPVYDHLFYATVSGNAATTATLWDTNGVDCEQYTYGVIDSCEITIGNDGIATISGNFMAKAPATVTAPTLSTVSGTLFTWKDLNARFGSTVAAARAASATKLNSLTITIENNSQSNYKSGSNQPDTITYGPVKVSGSYTLFFETTTDRDAYYALTKRSGVFTLTGAGIGAGFTEQIEIVVKKFRLEDIDMETGLDNLFAITCNFVAEMDQDQAGYVEATVRNQKSTNYV